jgi:lysosomal Pro-X carboxypeptidase
LFGAAAEKSEVTILPKASQGELNWAIGADAAIAPATNNSCSDAVRASWSALDRLSQQKNNTGVDWINKNFRLCPKSQLKTPSDVRTLKDYLTEIWTDLAMMDYPYPTTFLAPLPADPVTAACVGLAKPYDSDQKLLQNVFTGLNVYFNYTGDSKCLDLGDEDDIGAGMWTYQSCTEMVMPFCYDGTNDMFEAQAWDMDQYTKDCQETWGVTPRPSLANTLYGGRSLEAASNIVFTNGLLDPWSSGGVLKPVGGTAALIIPEGAHHLDLRAANPKDPVSVVDARKKERQFIEKWIKQWKTNRKKLNRTTTVMQGPI